MKKLKKGFWAGVLAFVIARFSHLLITFIIGLQIAIIYEDKIIPDSIWTTIAIIDSWIVGLMYIIPVSMYIYKKITI